MMVGRIAQHSESNKNNRCNDKNCFYVSVIFLLQSLIGTLHIVSILYIFFSNNGFIYENNTILYHSILFIFLLYMMTIEIIYLYMNGEHIANIENIENNEVLYKQF
jgi:hypothetical protein